MRIIVGLGNPGRKYVGTRHNIGFDVLAEIARRQSSTGWRSGFEAELLETTIGDQRVLLAAPQTFMNLSGRSVRKILDFYKLPLDELLVICDDLNLPVGKRRLRRSGSAGGQKGLKSIIDHVGGQDFARLRIGIGRPPERMDSAAYVLQRFSAAEAEKVEAAVSAASEAAEQWATLGVDAAMNRVNSPDAD